MAPHDRLAPILLAAKTDSIVMASNEHATPRLEGMNVMMSLCRTAYFFTPPYSVIIIIFHNDHPFFLRLPGPSLPNGSLPSNHKKKKNVRNTEHIQQDLPSLPIKRKIFRF